MNAAAVNKPEAIWARRDRDGDAVSLDAEGFAAEAFPTLLLRERWNDPEMTAPVREFFDWQAPRLLQLSGLDGET